MNIYYSNFDNVDLKHNTSEGKNYSEEGSDELSFAEKFDELSRKGEQRDSQFGDHIFGFNEFDAFA